MEQATSSGAVWAELIRRHAGGDTDKLRRAAEAVAGLEQHPGWTVVRELLEAKVDGLHRMILPPARHDHAAYIALTNQEFALRYAMDLPAQIVGVAESAAAAQRLAAERAAGGR